jgi:hypothetical protein
VKLVLAQLDPSKAADALSTGNPQTILAVALVFVVAVAVFLGKMLLDSFKTQLVDARADTAAEIKRGTDSTDTLRDMKVAIDRNTQTMDATLAVLKARA